MKIRIESTAMITEIDGVPVRLWEGVTESGVSCKVFVHRIAVSDCADQSQFENELMEMPAAGPVVPLSAIL